MTFKIIILDMNLFLVNNMYNFIFLCDGTFIDSRYLDM